LKPLLVPSAVFALALLRRRAPRSSEADPPRGSASYDDAPTPAPNRRRRRQRHRLLGRRKYEPDLRRVALSRSLGWLIVALGLLSAAGTLVMLMSGLITTRRAFEVALWVAVALVGAGLLVAVIVSSLLKQQLPPRRINESAGSSR
jgi:hypothetical protein